MYESFYKLTGKPFQLTPDPTFFYGSRGHRRAFSYLQYGLYQGEGFIVLTGDIGAGKTTIVRNLMTQLDPQRIVAAQLVSTQLNAEGLLQAVAVAFGINVKEREKARVIAELEAFLVSLAAKGKRAVLIVDEAQNLSPAAIEELRMLSNFQFQNKALLQSFLVGQPELRMLMRSNEMVQLRQRVISSYHLGPLDSEETKAYIEHRLRHVGWNFDPRFEPEAYELIHSYTGGVPRKINTLCNRLMLAGYLSENRLFGTNFVEQAIEEIVQEIGPESPPPAPAPQAPPPTRHVVVEPADILRLERRLARIEKAMATVVNYLKHTAATAATAEAQKNANKTASGT